MTTCRCAGGDEERRAPPSSATQYQGWDLESAGYGMGKPSHLRRVPRQASRGGEGRLLACGLRPHESCDRDEKRGEATKGWASEKSTRVECLPGRHGLLILLFCRASPVLVIACEMRPWLVGYAVRSDSGPEDKVLKSYAPGQGK
eukprot:1545617-Heterocapsa_arctica.AAC.1